MAYYSQNYAGILGSALGVCALSSTMKKAKFFSGYNSVHLVQAERTQLHSNNNNIMILVSSYTDIIGRSTILL